MCEISEPVLVSVDWKVKDPEVEYEDLLRQQKALDRLESRGFRMFAQDAEQLQVELRALNEEILSLRRRIDETNAIRQRTQEEQAPRIRRSEEVHKELATALHHLNSSIQALR
jgi:predicted  nucleic acid-binding Zn-ribbon protein